MRQRLLYSIILDYDSGISSSGFCHPGNPPWNFTTILSSTVLDFSANWHFPKMLPNVLRCLPNCYLSHSVYISAYRALSFSLVSIIQLFSFHCALCHIFGYFCHFLNNDKVLTSILFLSL